MAKVGVYICKCGGTISDATQFDEIVKAAEALPDVVVRINDLYCGADGQDVITKDIKAGVIDRFVTIACSPKMHSQTFGKVCQAGGLNPFMVQMVNIREQGIWMTPDKCQATEKIIRMMKAGIARIRYQEPLEQKEIEINPDVMVVGGGIAGVEAALALAKSGRKVYLVEKQAGFGGIIPKLEHTYPSNECAPCILAPRTKELMDCESIVSLNASAVKNVIGFGGNFTITLEQRPTFVIPKNCISCMMCIEVCPASAPNPYNGDMNNRKAMDFYFPGCVPKAPSVEWDMCVRSKGQICAKCKDACDFEAVDLEQKSKDIEVKVGTVILATGADVYDPRKVYPGLMDAATEVYSGMDFERICSTTGPTQGKIVKKNGEKPKSVAIIHCVGSRIEKHLPYCSGVCCKYALKQSHSIKSTIPECEVTHVIYDLCLEGAKFQKQVNDLKHEGVRFWNWQMGENAIADLKRNGDKIMVSGKGMDGQLSAFDADMVILATGFAPSADVSNLVKKFSLAERGGFITVEHEKIRGVSSTGEGVYLAGTLNGPKDITASVIEAKAAVGEILSTYVAGRKLKLEPMVAESNPDLCCGCKSCVSMCPYNAPNYDEAKKVVIVSEVLCKGCGTCVATCPAGAMRAKNFTSQQIVSEIKGVLS
ncbi:MAG: CoB--CoM heterodisulfide reductase iron-sulfur subunit A family protein [Candidatus Omnitrophota bacterium]